MPIRGKVKSKNQNANTAVTPRAKKTCYFCDNKVEPTFTDSATLKKFISDRAKIVAHTRNGLCSRHQRLLSKNVKYARHLSLLPFVASI